MGASGGCYALIAAHLANIIINWGEMPFNWMRLLVILALMATDIGVFAYATVTQSTTRVSKDLKATEGFFFLEISSVLHCKAETENT